MNQLRFVLTFYLSKIKFVCNNFEYLSVSFETKNK